MTERSPEQIKQYEALLVKMLEEQKKTPQSMATRILNSAIPYKEMATIANELKTTDTFIRAVAENAVSDEGLLDFSLGFVDWLQTKLTEIIEEAQNKDKGKGNVKS